jgi:hypothetical protein
MDQMIEGVFGAVLFLGLGLAGLAILILSACYARSRRVCFRWGFLAGIFMSLQCVLLMWGADFRSAFDPGTGGYGMAKGAGLFFVLCLLVYSFVASDKFSNKQ